MRRFAIGLAALGWAANGSSAPSNLGSWQPAGPFKLSSTKDRCIAVSNFSRGDKKMLVALEGNPGGLGFELRLYTPGTLRRWDEGRFSLGNARLENDLVFVRVGPAADTMIYRLGLSRENLEEAGPSPTLTMRQIVNPGDVNLSGLHAAAATVEACKADLLERWGYSKEAQRAFAVQPKPKKEWTAYVSSDDYPKLALYARAGGETRLLIDVGVDGKGSNCRIIAPSGRPELDEMSCKIVTERAEYEPGRDATEAPIKTPFYFVFRWEMPRPPWL